MATGDGLGADGRSVVSAGAGGEYPGGTDHGGIVAVPDGAWADRTGRTLDRWAAEAARSAGVSDPIEAALVAHIAMAHARAMHLLRRLASDTTGFDGMLAMHDAVDRASNTVRRLALSVIEYRKARDGDG